MARIVCCGEGMLEMSRQDGAWRLGYGGDTLNTAIHLARRGHEVAYLTALGDDAFSAQLRREWAGEGLDLGLVLTHPARHAGLYAIDTDPAGERSFTYWRSESAAREMFALAAMAGAMAEAERADLFYFSLITLAVLPPEHRGRLLDLARRVRETGGQVAFDGNYRPRLWSTREEAIEMRDLAIAVAGIGLPTLDDERALSGVADARAVAEHWQALGCGETVVKLGPEGCRLPGGALAAPAQALDPVDTSGAGDAFNAGYLDARLRGSNPAEAAAAGNELAAWTIMRPGAIPPRGVA